MTIIPFQQSPKICPVCLAESNFKFIRDYQSKNGNFSLYECPNCEVQFWVPFQNPGAEWYEKNSYNVHRKQISNEKYIRWAVKHYWHTGQFLKSPPHSDPKEKTLLDIACSTGGFMLEAKEIGYTVYGVDFDKEEINIAKKFGLNNVYAEDVIQFLKNHREKFDVITGFEVIEHLDRPKEFLKLINDSLKPNGYLVLSTPNRKRYFGKIFELWDFPYYHLMRFDRQSLKNFVEQTNFIVVKIKDQNAMDFFVNATRVGLGKFLRKKLNKTNVTEMPPELLDDKISQIGFIKDVFVKIVLFPLVTLLYWIGFKGPDMYLVAKKS
ncbi:MAG: class I SAM-dependent methyltransferase [Candidatus Nealsonbacteria bacterium]